MAGLKEKHKYMHGHLKPSVVLSQLLQSFNYQHKCIQRDLCVQYKGLIISKGKLIILSLTECNLMDSSHSYIYFFYFCDGVTCNRAIT